FMIRPSYLSLTNDIRCKCVKFCILEFEWFRAWTGSAIDRTAGRVSEIGRLSRATPRSGVAAFGGRRPLTAVQSRNCRVALPSMAPCDHRKLEQASPV